MNKLIFASLLALAQHSSAQTKTWTQLTCAADRWPLTVVVDVLEQKAFVIDHHQQAVDVNEGLRIVQQGQKLTVYLGASIALEARINSSGFGTATSHDGTRPNTYKCTAK